MHLLLDLDHKIHSPAFPAFGIFTELYIISFGWVFQSRWGHEGSVVNPRPNKAASQHGTANFRPVGMLDRWIPPCMTMHQNMGLCVFPFLQ
jgi:hypothetical protein